MRGRVPAALLVALGLCAAVAPARADDAACIAASEKSLTLRRQGKLHDALKELAVCADAACPDEVKQECSRRIEAVGAAMPTVVLEAKNGAGNDLLDVAVTMDGAPLVAKLDGHSISIDPGEHAFVFEVAGQPRVEKRLVLREGERDRHEGVVLGAPAPPPPPPAGAPSPVVPAPAAPSAPWSLNKTFALASAGVGLVGVGLGVAFGLYAVSSQNREKGDCSASGCPNYAQSVEDYNTAKKDATGSTVAFAVGAGLVAVGAVLWWTAPRDSGAAVRVVPSPIGTGGGLVVGGRL